MAKKTQKELMGFYIIALGIILAGAVIIGSVFTGKAIAPGMQFIQPTQTTQTQSIGGEPAEPIEPTCYTLADCTADMREFGTQNNPNTKRTADVLDPFKTENVAKGGGLITIAKP